MNYRYMTEQEDYTPYASGVVLHSIGGHPPLPVRLSSEAFLRAFYHWSKVNKGTCRLYDPMCGLGASLVTLKYRHWKLISSIVGSDIDRDCLEVARLNFELLTHSGLARRIRKIKDDYAAFGKQSHRTALQAALYLKKQIQDPVDRLLFQADATELEQIQRALSMNSVDMAFFDVPYGKLSAWEKENAAQGDTHIEEVLKNLHRIMSPNGVAVVFTGKGKKIKTPFFKCFKKLSVGKRLVWLFEKRQ